MSEKILIYTWLRILSRLLEIFDVEYVLQNFLRGSYFKVTQSQSQAMTQKLSNLLKKIRAMYVDILGYALAFRHQSIPATPQDVLNFHRRSHP